jgi:hypothetical protein
VVGGRLQTERMGDGRRKLLRDLVVEVDGERFTIPEGTLTDYSSIPWFGCALVRWSKVDVAGVVHDWLYQTGATSRARADKIWRLVAMAGEHHANALQAWIGWFALWAGGWVVWRWYRRRD